MRAADCPNYIHNYVHGRVYKLPNKNTCLIRPLNAVHNCRVTIFPLHIYTHTEGQSHIHTHTSSQPQRTAATKRMHNDTYDLPSPPSPPSIPSLPQYIEMCTKLPRK